MSFKPVTLTWVNPTAREDGTTYDAKTENAGYTIQVDGTAAVSIPLAFGTSFDLTTLGLFVDLKQGNHTAALAAVDKAGGQSAFSGAVTFPRNYSPRAPTALVIS